MSGRLTTHVLDTSRGVPAAGMRYVLFRCDHDRSARMQIAAGITNEDGRSPTPLLQGQDFQSGTYVLEFDVSNYHLATGQMPEHPFLGLVSIAFTISDESRHLHVPLLVSPFGYTTYRGS